MHVELVDGDVSLLAYNLVGHCLHITSRLLGCDVRSALLMRISVVLLNVLTNLTDLFAVHDIFNVRSGGDITAFVDEQNAISSIQKLNYSIC